MKKTIFNINLPDFVYFYLLSAGKNFLKRRQVFS